mmetsp:Transcript_4828/g.11597  ORF Transcript_4828/g.11597 Transcript_4828/m.11597 type:complete len:106 (+) Transcript_4828:234-551(+)
MTFLLIIDAVGEGWTFMLYVPICPAAMAFVTAFVPETRNRSLEAIEISLREATGENTDRGGGGGDSDSAVGDTTDEIQMQGQGEIELTDNTSLLLATDSRDTAAV